MAAPLGAAEIAAGVRYFKAGEMKRLPNGSNAANREGSVDLEEK